MTAALPLEAQAAPPLLLRQALAVKLWGLKWPKHKIAARCQMTMAELDQLIRERRLPPRESPKKYPWHLAGARHRPDGRPTHRCPYCCAESLDRDRCRTELPDGTAGGCGRDLLAYYDDPRRFRGGRA